MAFDWSTAVTAFASWARSASELGQQNVFWSGQDAPRPEGLYIELGPFRLVQNGFDWIDYDDNPLTLADDDVESVDTGLNRLTLTGHAYQTGDGPVRLTTTGTLPTGLSLDTDYWIIVHDANTISLTAKFSESINGTPVVGLSSGGSGTHTISDTAETLRAGEEIIQVARGPRQLGLLITCYSGNTPAVPVVGVGSAFQTLDKLIRRTRLPSVRSILENAEIGVATFAQIQSVDALKGMTDFEPRARTELQMFIAVEETDSAFTTIIESFEAQETNTGITFFVPEDPT